MSGKKTGRRDGPGPVRHDVRLLDDSDLEGFFRGAHSRVHEKLGAHPAVHGGERGTTFGVWAPNAGSVSVMGSFNGWDVGAHPLRRRESGIWEGFIPDVEPGATYKYHVVAWGGAFRADKTDPYGFFQEVAPRTASVVWDLDYAWGDAAWMADRRRRNALDAPISIYEVHLGSWRRVAEDGYRSLSYREHAQRLADHVARAGFTHVELLPVMEHPFFGSWGYQATGFFAPSSRYGTPQELMHLIDTLHQRGIGVILDWVPSHFATDGHGLGMFDGTRLYEHADPRRGFHPDWQSYIFDYGRGEVASFLLSSACYWLDRYHADGLRVDAVASMLYLDYSRDDGEWAPNEHGGRENLQAIRFLERLNETVYREFPDVQTIAEESTAWPQVSRPTWAGGLGFGLKWDMGWMHDTLRYFGRDPVHRRFHHDDLTFRMLYAYHENFVLPLSHDEVVHGKGSLFGKMSGDDWQKRAHLRLLLGFQFTQSGKKLLFMGGELGQHSEWNHDGSLAWELLEDAAHAGILRWVTELNRLYRERPALHARDCEPDGFEWVQADDAASSVLSYLRRGGEGQVLLVVGNFTPAPRPGYRVGAPQGGAWRVAANSDAPGFGGSGAGSSGTVEAQETGHDGRPSSLVLDLPPLGLLLLEPEAEDGAE